LEQLIAEKRTLEKKLDEAHKSGGAGVDVTTGAEQVGGYKVVSRAAVQAADVKELQALGDAVRAGLGSGAGVLSAAFEDGKATLLIVVTDDLRDRGVSASDLVKAFGAKTGARGGGKPHMAQAGIDAAQVKPSVDIAAGIVRSALEAVL
ncbi:MAG TPA: DHHA1 domain-containing protein, partial [Gemmatimonadaceae bacterium]|nr:DHHA1 domain-containing protein [Gemmatimonadaceae bacterium]